MGGPAIIVQRISCYERRRRRHCFHCRDGGIFAAQEGDDSERTEEDGGIGRRRPRSGLQLAPGIQNVAWEWRSGKTYHNSGQELHTF